MHLTPADQDKLLLSMAGLIARERRARGVILNYPAAVALLACWVIERARDGATAAQLIRDGLALLDAAVELAPGRDRRRVRVLNGGDRPIQVGSHFHFADVNAALEF